MELNTGDTEKKEQKTSGEEVENSPAEENFEGFDPNVELSLLQVRLEEKESEIKKLREQVVKFESQIADVREYVKKMESEVESIRERAKRDTERNLAQASIDFLSKFLGAVDDLERSLETEAQDAQTMREGVELVYKQIEKSLKEANVEPIDEAEVDFDPNKHEAMATIPSQPEQEGKVIEVLRKGYVFKDQLVRPAQVVVGRDSSD